MKRIVEFFFFLKYYCMCATGKKLPREGESWCLGHLSRGAKLLTMEIEKGNTPSVGSQLLLVDYFTLADAAAADILMRLDARLGGDGLCEKAREKIVDFAYLEFVQKTLAENALRLNPATIMALTEAFCKEGKGIKELLKEIFVSSPHYNREAKEYLLIAVKQNMPQADEQDKENLIKEGLEIIQYCIENGWFPIKELELQAQLGEPWAQELLAHYQTKGLP